MKNNRLTIDLDRLEIGIETAYTIQEIKTSSSPRKMHPHGSGGEVFICSSI